MNECTDTALLIPKFHCRVTAAKLPLWDPDSFSAFGGGLSLSLQNKRKGGGNYCTSLRMFRSLLSVLKYMPSRLIQQEASCTCLAVKFIIIPFSNLEYIVYQKFVICRQRTYYTTIVRRQHKRILLTFHYNILDQIFITEGTKSKGLRSN